MASDGASGADRSDNSSKSSDRSSGADNVSKETTEKTRDAVSGKTDPSKSTEASQANRRDSQAKMEAMGKQAAQGMDDQAATAAQTAAKAATGYRADMYGEIGVGNRTANIAGQRQFGGAVTNSTLEQSQFTARKGSGGAPKYGIDEFARQDFRGDMARNSAISSTATYNDAVARSRAPGGPAPDKVQFEVPRANSSGVRTDDMVVDRQLTVETKAGQTLVDRQLKVDVPDAKVGMQLEIVTTNNPQTGANGLNARGQTQVADAIANSNGNISHVHKADIAPSKASLEALETAAKVSRVGRALGKVAVPVGIAADTYAIGSAYAADGYTVGSNTKVAAAEAAGGWAGAGAGAWGGAKAGAAIGTMVGGPIGTAVGAVAGGIVGAVGGALVGSGVVGGWAKSWFG